MEAYYQAVYTPRSDALLVMSSILVGTIISMILAAAIGFAAWSCKVAKPSPGRCSKLSASILSCLMK